MLIGRQSGRVFEDIETFLNDPAPAANLPDGNRRVFDVPWIGPRFDLPDAGALPLLLGGLPRPDQGEARLCLIPVLWTPQGFAVLPLPRCVSLSRLGHKRQWLMARTRLRHWPAPVRPTAGLEGYLALLMYREDESTSLDDPGWPHPLGPAAQPMHGTPEPERPPPMAAGPQAGAAREPNGADGAVPELPGTQFSGWLGALLAARLLRLEAQGGNVQSVFAPALATVQAPAAGPATTLLRDAERWIRTRTSKDLEHAFVLREDIERAERSSCGELGEVPLRFAVASCQYPRGLLDQPVASKSLDALHARADELDLALFLGDQIYADATAGLVDPVRRDELFDWPHDHALRLPAMRNVLQRLPAHMLLDDHEIIDNWEPLPAAVKARRPADVEANKQRRQQGFKAWRHYQRMRSNGRATSGDHAFMHGGHPFYLLDTRSGRKARGSLVQATGQSLFGRTQWRRLCAWLLSHKHALKFVATPSLLLPRRRYTVEQPGHAAYSDAWDGYTQSMQRLAEFIVSNDIRHTVFLSGDEHHALYAETTLRRAGAPATDPGIRLVSIHGSALYAPMPFANGRPADLKAFETFRLGAVEVQVRTTFAPQGDGFARVEVLNGTTVALSFIKADGGTPAVSTTLAV